MRISFPRDSVIAGFDSTHFDYMSLRDTKALGLFNVLEINFVLGLRSGADSLSMIIRTALAFFQALD